MTAVADPRLALLQSMMSGGANAPSQEEVLQQLAGSDPTTAMVLQYMAQQRAAAAEAQEEQDEEDDGAIEGTARFIDTEQAERTSSALQNLRQRVESLYVELEDLRGRNRDLAAALGACSRCWGDDKTCPVCEGLGRPGGAAPDPFLYKRLIAPAVRRTNYWDSADGPQRPAVSRVPENGKPRRIREETQ